MADTPDRGFRRLDRSALSGSLGAVYRQAQEFDKLRQALASALPADESKHLIGVAGSDKKLVVFADSPAWATRLRYRAPDLEAAAIQCRGTRPHLVFRVGARHGVAEQPHRSPWLPEHVVNTLESSARTVKDEGLAAALRRLARGADR